jgi:predicted nucleotidyltransferase
MTIKNKKKWRGIKRVTADRLLAEFSERVRHVNSSDEFLFKVTEAVVFGSYVNTDHEVLGDLDLAIRTDTKKEEMGEAEHHERFLEQQNECNSHVMIERIFYPHTKVWKYLKNRSTGISLHDLGSDGVFAEDVPMKRIYPPDQEVQ